MKRLQLLLLILVSTTFAWGQEVKEVPASHQEDGLLYFAHGSIQAPASMRWYRVEESTQTLYIALPPQQAQDPDFFFNMMIEESSAKVDEQAAQTLLQEMNAGKKLTILKGGVAEAPLSGVELSYQLPSVKGSLRLAQVSGTKRMALMGEGRGYDKAVFQKVVNSYKAGAKPPPEWDLRVQRWVETKLVKSNVARLEIGGMRVPAGFEWLQLQSDRGQTLLGQRKKPYAKLGISATPYSEKLNQESAVALGVEFLGSIDSEGLVFRPKPAIALSDPITGSYLIPVEGRSHSGRSQPGRVFVGQLEGQLFMIGALGVGDATSLSVAMNSFGRVATAAEMELEAQVEQLDSLTPDKVSDTLVLVSCAIFAAVFAAVSCFGLFRNLITDGPAKNPFVMALKGMAAIYSLQVMVGAWLLHQNGGSMKQIGTQMLWTTAVFLITLLPPALFASIWKRSAGKRKRINAS